MRLDCQVILLKLVIGCAKISMVGCYFGVDFNGLSSKPNFFPKVTQLTDSFPLEVHKVAGFVLIAEVQTFFANLSQLFPFLEVQVSVREEQIFLFGARHVQSKLHHLLILFFALEDFDFLCSFLVHLDRHRTAILEIVKLNLHQSIISKTRCYKIDIKELSSREKMQQTQLICLAFDIFTQQFLYISKVYLILIYIQGILKKQQMAQYQWGQEEHQAQYQRGYQAQYQWGQEENQAQQQRGQEENQAQQQRGQEENQAQYQRGQEEHQAQYQWGQEEHQAQISRMQTKISRTQKELQEKQVQYLRRLKEKQAQISRIQKEIQATISRRQKEKQEIQAQSSRRQKEIQAQISRRQKEYQAQYSLKQEAKQREQKAFQKQQQMKKLAYDQEQKKRKQQQIQNLKGGDFFNMLKSIEIRDEIIALLNRQQIQSVKQLKGCSQQMLIAVGVPLGQIAKLRNYNFIK